MNIYENWLDGKWVEDGVSIPAGSPERVLRRFVLQSTTSDEKFVFEGSDMHRRGHREEQARFLERLKQNGCGHILPWLRTKDGDFGKTTEFFYWQCRRYASGLELDRENYGNDAWRGKVLADFLVDLKKASNGIVDKSHPFYISDYIHSLMPKIKERNPALHSDLSPIFEELHHFLHDEKTLRLCFCHGDYHPLNVLWGENELTGVIDWEFAGIKPVLYDIANMTGCVGMDNPEFLTGNLVMTFLTRLQHDSFIDKEEIRALPEYMAALRFAWMREWCWRNEKEMMIQELDYIWLLLDNRKLLADRWITS